MAQKKKKPLTRCALKKWDCIQCNSKGLCTLLTDMQVVSKQHHCGFYKKRNNV